MDLMAFKTSDLNVQVSQKLDSCLIRASRNNLSEIHISWSTSHFSLLILVMKSKKRSWFSPPDCY